MKFIRSTSNILFLNCTIFHINESKLFANLCSLSNQCSWI
uniref:Uncharacterized protein n=1 Tax=Anguilla anguilla TaxID=7936 RepID=A0A0E9T0X7_ANGAN